MVPPLVDITEHRAFLVVPVNAHALVVRRGVDDEFFLVEALQRPGRVDVIERVEESGDKMHQNGT